MRWSPVCVVACLSVATSWAAAPVATPEIDTVHTDLNALIDQAARSPVQFAVNIRHGFSTSAQGHWAKQAATSIWTYSVRVPTAISMSFHAAPGVQLPSSAVLTVKAGSRFFRYTTRDISHSGLWGRPMPGDTLAFSLSVSTAQASQVRLQFASVQAGYRSLGANVPDHPHYRELKRAAVAAAAAAAGCTENYACHVTAANQGPSHATVAVIVQNLYQCTGTLLNDARSDGAPYVLTARHCQQGELGGGYPDVADQVSFYWDAVSPCDGQLGALYDSSSPVPMQTGATTVLEQEDLWLLRLSTAPVSSDAYYAGWDASGTAFAGGYTIHHALGGKQQYVEWSGTAVLEHMGAATFNVAYDSTFWGVVNGLGNVGAGASGSALFNPSNLVVGSASLAELTSGEGSGVCPVNPPPTPKPDTITSLFTSLSGAWTSTADRTSSTPNATLKSLLDPDATGQVTAQGMATQPITVTASATGANSGDLVTVSWNAPGAQSCTASGGTNGDGWAGVQPASGSVQLTDAGWGLVTYSLNCVIGSQIGAGSVSVNWDYNQPYTGLTGGNSYPLQVGTAVSMNWGANVSPCTASGGIPGDGWAGAQPTSGSVQTSISQPGMATYTLTCGTGARAVTDSVYAYAVATPRVWMFSNLDTATVNSSFALSWQNNGIGLPCTASGGSSSDGWANPDAYANGAGYFREATPGSYTFTLTCTLANGQTTSASQTVLVTNATPVISLVPVAPRLQAGVPAGPYYNLYYTASDPGDCNVTDNSTAGTMNGSSLLGMPATGGIADYESRPGTVTYTLRCGPQTATATIDWVAEPVPSVLTTTATTWAANVAYPVAWDSSVGPCAASGGGSGDGWAGAKGQSGTQNLAEPRPGGYMFTLTCGSGAAATTSNLVVLVASPIIQVYTTPDVIDGGTFAATQINWNSGLGPCSYYDGSSGNSAGISVPPYGNRVPSPAVSGEYLFTVTCGSGAMTTTAGTLAYVPVQIPTTISASASQITVDSAVKITWSSAGENICFAEGGTGTVPWYGPLGGSGVLVVTSHYAGPVTYAVGCGDQYAQVIVTYVAVPGTSSDASAPAVSLSSSVASLVVNHSFTLTWNAQHADSCEAGGGNGGDGWSGTLATSGSMTVEAATVGPAKYSITCTGAPPAATATTSVDIKSEVVVSTQSSGGGGGGALDLLLVAGLAVGLAMQLASGRRLRSLQ